jgi:protein required for attachment to host cells
MKTWVVIANSSFAEFFEISGKKTKKIEQLDYPEGRQREGDLASDRPGRTFNRMANGHRHAFQSTLHAHAQEVFAQQIADKLHAAWNNHAFTQLVLIAGPDMLGELRHAISTGVKKTVWKEFVKDFSGYLSEEERIRNIHGLLEMESS